MTTNFKQLAEQYKHELLDKVVPFWLDKSQDTQYGGYFTCLERDGSVFDTDKFVWLQGREVWMFATLYNKVEKRQEWLDCAIQGAEFLKSTATTASSTGTSPSTARDTRWLILTTYSHTPLP